MREIIYDTETTGKRFQDGHRVVEVAAVELVDGKLTGREFHVLINPERSIPDEVVAIHGITDDMVANAPKFREILPDLLDFIRGAKVIAHNSEFDEKFLNNELQLANHPESFWSVVEDTADTIEMSRKIWVGKDKDGKNYKHNLDVVLDRCGIDRTARVKHGALIDSQLLATAYLSMKLKLSEMGPTLEDDAPRGPITRVTLKTPLPAITITEDQQNSHNDYLSSIRPTSSSLKM